MWGPSRRVLGTPRLLVEQQAVHSECWLRARSYQVADAAEVSFDKGEHCDRVAFEDRAAGRHRETDGDVIRARNQKFVEVAPHRLDLEGDKRWYPKAG